MKIIIDKKKVLTSFEEMDGAVGGMIGGMSSAGAMGGGGEAIPTYGGKSNPQVKDKYPKRSKKVI